MPRTVLVPALLLGAACARGESPAPGGPPAGPNLLLVVVDTLGAEHLGSYGAEGDPSPALDRLAAGGARFERAYATAPWTQPSIASLFTSQMPARHRVRNLTDRLPPRATTLAEELQAAGRRTHGVISHFLIDREFGFAQGFESFDASAVGGHDAITSREVTDAALQWLREEAREPFFLFVHYFDPHFVYHHHADFDRTAGYRGPLRPGMPIWDLRDRRDALSAQDVDYLVGLYREEIAFTDHQIGRLLEHVEAAGLDRRTLTVFAADHGEEFMRHGWIGHTRSLYDELLRVPLVLHQPGVVPAGVIAEPVSLVDVVPTLADLLGLEAERPFWEGRSLAARVRDPRRRLDERPVFAEVTFDPPFGDPRRAAQKRAMKSAILLGGKKLVHDRAEDRWELYDHATDALELRDRFGEDPAGDAGLQERLRAFERASPLPDSGERPVDAVELQRLQDLGYAR